MFDGIIPFSRASFSLDLVSIAMWLVIPALLFSVYLVKYKKRYQLHKTLQLCIVGALLTAIVIFEIDMRLYGWKQYAEPSIFFDNWLFPVFYIHLTISILTTIIWTITVTGALRKLPKPPAPNAYSHSHKKWGRLSVLSMCLTAVSGWIFYTMAFIY